MGEGSLLDVIKSHYAFRAERERDMESIGEHTLSEISSRTAKVGVFLLGDLRFTTSEHTQDRRGHLHTAHPRDLIDGSNALISDSHSPVPGVYCNGGLPHNSIFGNLKRLTVARQ